MPNLRFHPPDLLLCILLVNVSLAGAAFAQPEERAPWILYGLALSVFCVLGVARFDLGCRLFRRNR